MTVLEGIPPDTYPGSPDRPVRHPGLAGLSWMSVSELDWLISRLPDSGLYVEVGTASGVSAAKIADARPGLTILCVDSYADSHLPHVAENEPNRLVNWKANRRTNMHLFVGTLWDLASLVPREFLADAILVDADHSEEAAGRDLHLAAAMLAPGGSLFVHDVDEPGHPGVTVAVDRFCAASGFEAIGQHWTLRELRKGSPMG